MKNLIGANKMKDKQGTEGGEQSTPLILSELFGERELEYFGVVPQSILNSIGEILLSQYVDTNSKLLKETLPTKCHTFLSQSQIEGVHDLIIHLSIPFPLS